MAVLLREKKETEDEQSLREGGLRPPSGPTELERCANVSGQCLECESIVVSGLVYAGEAVAGPA